MLSTFKKKAKNVGGTKRQQQQKRWKLTAKESDRVFMSRANNFKLSGGRARVTQT